MIRDITATRPWLHWPSWASAVTCRSRTAGGVAGGESLRRGRPSALTGGAFGASAGGACCGSVGNASSVPTPTLYETGRLRRVHLCGHANVLKRLLVHVCGSNLGLLMRELTGVGTPRSLQGRARALLDALIRALSRRWRLVALSGADRPFDPRDSSWIAPATQRYQLVPLTLQGGRSAAAC